MNFHIDPPPPSRHILSTPRFVFSINWCKVCAVTSFLACFSILPAAHSQFVEHTITSGSTHVATADELQILKNTALPAVLIHPGDGYIISVLNVTTFNTTVNKDGGIKGRVASDGSVDLPMAGRLTLAGMTTEDAQTVIRNRLRDLDLVLQAQVVVTIDQSDSATVSVTGEVKHPGIFPASGRHTLADYLAEAEGIKDTGSSIVTLIRPSLLSALALDLGAYATKSEALAVPIYAGDTIVVPNTGSAYAVGAFKTQGAYPLKNYGPTTVLQLVAEAGGEGYEAALNDSVIVRRTPQGLQEVPVHLGDILKHRTHDVPLQADDILYVPTNKTKAAIKGGAANIAVGLAAAFIYTR